MLPPASVSGFSPKQPCGPNCPFDVTLGSRKAGSTAMRAIAKAALIVVAVGLVSPVIAADPRTIDWPKIPVKSITLFYPGQSTYDWLVSPAHPGAKMVSEGGACLTCHKGSEKARGEKIVKGGSLEPTPIPGKNGSLDVKVQAAHDADYVYFRFQWKTKMKREG